MGRYANLSDLSQFQQYYQLADKVIGRYTKEQLAECARLLALNLAHYQGKFGEMPLEETLAVLGVTQPNDEEAVLLQPVPGGGRGHARRDPVDFFRLRHRQGEDQGFRDTRIPELPVVSFPGIVIGVGFMWFFVQTPLYATIWALLLGYIATYLPYGIRPMSSAFIQIHRHLEESSLVCGASPMTTMRRIIVPLLIPGIVSGWILMAPMFVRELTLSVVLSRPGTEVLAVQILRFSEDGLWGRLSALGIVMIGITTALVVAATLIGNRFKTV